MITIRVIVAAIEVDKFTMLVIKRAVPGIKSAICAVNVTGSAVVFIYFRDSSFPIFL